MQTIALHGENYNLETDKAISIGYNMRGNKCITSSILYFSPDGELICKNGGIEIIVNDLKVFYLDTPTNRKLLKQKIN